MTVSIRSLVARVVEPFRTPPPPAVRHIDAGALLRPESHFPLVYVTNISGWSEDPRTSQVSFSLKHGAEYVHEAASFQVKVPGPDGDLFDKRGAYVVVLAPVTSQAQVDQILRLARQFHT